MKVQKRAGMRDRTPRRLNRMARTRLPLRLSLQWRDVGAAAVLSVTLPASAQLAARRVVIVSRPAVRHEEALPDAEEKARHQAEQLRNDESVVSLLSQLSRGQEQVGGAGRHQDCVEQNVADQELSGLHRNQRHHVLFLLVSQVKLVTLLGVDRSVLRGSEPRRPGDCGRAPGDVLLRELVVLTVIVVPAAHIDCQHSLRTDIYPAGRRREARPNTRLLTQSWPHTRNMVTLPPTIRQMTSRARGASVRSS